VVIMKVDPHPRRWQWNRSHKKITQNMQWHRQTRTDINWCHDHGRTVILTQWHRTHWHRTQWCDSSKAGAVSRQM